MTMEIVQKKLSEIEKEMLAQMQTTKAIDAKNQVIDSVKFESVVKAALKKAYDLFPLVESEAGATIDRNAANILYSRIQFYNDMLETRLFDPYSMIVEPEIDSKSTKFAAGKVGIFSKLGEKFKQLGNKRSR